MTAPDDGLVRCDWAVGRPGPDFMLYRDYHDREWGQPLHGLVPLFERMSLEAFQSGLSWLIILRKRENFRNAFDGFDEPAAQAILDRLVSDLSVTAVMREIVLPYLAELGDRWERGDASIAREHFASNLIRGRLAGLARGWGDGSGPRAILA